MNRKGIAVKKKVDILMVCFNHVDATQKAVESLVHSTDPKEYRLILINNGSFDETVNWAYQNLHKYDIEYKVVSFDTNVGWVTAINQVFEIVDVGHFLTCHNDVVFEKGWLDKMLARFDDKTAIVGPTSDFILGLQSHRMKLAGLMTEKVKFVCGLFSLFSTQAVRNLIEQDGFFMDPVFGLGDKEELDYSIRLREMGYDLKVVRDVFIHHDGERGFVDKLGSKEAFHEYQDDQLKILIDKHGRKVVDDVFMIKTEERLNMCIGIPTRIDYLHRKFFASMVMLQKSGAFQIVDCPRFIIHEARNKIVEKSLELGATHLLFIDDDMIFPPDAAIRLLSHDVDIVCGLAFRRAAPYHPVIYRNIGSDIMAVHSIREGLIDIDACGSAFILIKSEVFRKMSKPWYVYGDKSLDIYTEHGGLGEDLSFSLRAKRMGFRVCCDTDLIITHLGAEQEIDDKTYLDYKEENPDTCKLVDDKFILSSQLMKGPEKCVAN